MTNTDVSPPMDGRIPRRFQLWDAMVLVAAIAVGLALAKIALPGVHRPKAPGFYRSYAIECGHAAAFPCAASLTVACLLLRLRRPRPPLRRMPTQPGVAACCMAVVQLLVGVFAAVNNAPECSLDSFIFVLSPVVAMGVAMAWWVLWYFGWWRSEPDWVDRMGRALGVCWIILPFVLYSALI